MILSDLLFSRTVSPDLEKSMDAYSLRQKVISNNIANVMTPGYRAQQVSFEEDYKRSLETVKMRGTTTHENHLSIPGNLMTFSRVHPKVEFKEASLNDSGLNNVDIDKEMAEMAENALRYEMSTKLINKRYMNIKNAIRGR